MDDRIKIYDSLRGSQSFLYLHNNNSHNSMKNGYATTNSTKIKKHLGNLFAWKKKKSQHDENIVDYPFVTNGLSDESDYRRSFENNYGSNIYKSTLNPLSGRVPSLINSCSSPTSNVIHPSLRTASPNKQQRQSLFYSPWESPHVHEHNDEHDTHHNHSHDPYCDLCTCAGHYPKLNTNHKNTNQKYTNSFGQVNVSASMGHVSATMGHSSGAAFIAASNNCSNTNTSPRRRRSRIELYSLKEEDNYCHSADLEMKSKSIDSLYRFKNNSSLDGMNATTGTLKSSKSSTTLSSGCGVSSIHSSSHGVKSKLSKSKHNPYIASAPATVNERFLRFLKKSSSDPFNSIVSRKSILECEISAYDLIQEHIKASSLVETDMLDVDNLHDNAIHEIQANRVRAAHENVNAMTNSNMKGKMTVGIVNKGNALKSNRKSLTSTTSKSFEPLIESNSSTNIYGNFNSGSDKFDSNNPVCNSNMKAVTISPSGDALDCFSPNNLRIAGHKTQLVTTQMPLSDTINTNGLAHVEKCNGDTGSLTSDTNARNHLSASSSWSCFNHEGVYSVPEPDYDSDNVIDENEIESDIHRRKITSNDKCIKNTDVKNAETLNNSNNSNNSNTLHNSNTFNNSNSNINDYSNKSSINISRLDESLDTTSLLSNIVHKSLHESDVTQESTSIVASENSSSVRRKATNGNISCTTSNNPTGSPIGRPNIAINNNDIPLYRETNDACIYEAMHFKSKSYSNCQQNKTSDKFIPLSSQSSHSPPSPPPLPPPNSVQSHKSAIKSQSTPNPLQSAPIASHQMQQQLSQQSSMPSFQNELKDKLSSGVKSILKKNSSSTTSTCDIQSPGKNQSASNSNQVMEGQRTGTKTAQQQLLVQTNNQLKQTSVRSASNDNTNDSECDYLKAFKEFKEAQRLRGGGNGRHRKHVHFRSRCDDSLIVDSIREAIPELDESEEPIYDDIELPPNGAPYENNEKNNCANNDNKCVNHDINTSENDSQQNCIEEQLSNWNSNEISSLEKQSGPALKQNNFNSLSNNSNNSRNSIGTTTAGTGDSNNKEEEMSEIQQQEFSEFDPSAEEDSPLSSRMKKTNMKAGDTVVANEKFVNVNACDMKKGESIESFNNQVKPQKEPTTGIVKNPRNARISSILSQNDMGKSRLVKCDLNTKTNLKTNYIKSTNNKAPNMMITNEKKREGKEVPPRSTSLARKVTSNSINSSSSNGLSNSKPSFLPRSFKQEKSDIKNCDKQTIEQNNKLIPQKQLSSQLPLPVFGRENAGGKKNNISGRVDAELSENTSCLNNNDKEIENTKCKDAMNDLRLTSTTCAINKDGNTFNAKKNNGFGLGSTQSASQNDETTNIPISAIANSRDKIIINVPSDDNGSSSNCNYETNCFQEHIYEELNVSRNEVGVVDSSFFIDTQTRRDSDLDSTNSESPRKSIFEGASKDEILDYLEDAKERVEILIDHEPELLDTINVIDVHMIDVDEPPRQIETSISPTSTSMSFSSTSTTSTSSNRRNRTSNVSNSSTDSNATTVSSVSVDIDDELIGTNKNGISDSTSFGTLVERNDSGVGTETKNKPLRLKKVISLEGDEVEHQCADCDNILQPSQDELTGLTNYPLFCLRCDKKRSERKEIISEIVDTEFKYGRDLRIIRDEFYRPIEVAGLLTKEQLKGVFLNLDELIAVNCKFAEKLQDAIDIANEQGDEDFTTINIGKLYLEMSAMLNAFESYCVRQGSAAMLLNHLEKEKELLRIFLRVSQMENTLLRRMNLRSFLVVPVQRVTKYPLLLSRLYKVTPYHHRDRDALREAQQKVELHLEHINQQTKGSNATNGIWRRISNLSSASSHRRTACDDNIGNIKIRKAALQILNWNQEETQFVTIGKLLFTQITDYSVNKKAKNLKFLSTSALIVTLGRPNKSYRPDLVNTGEADREMMFANSDSGITDAVLLLIKEKGGRFVVCKEPFHLSSCIIATESEEDQIFEIHHSTNKESYLFKAENPDDTRGWLKQLRYHAKDQGMWKRRRNALANIMMRQ